MRDVRRLFTPELSDLAPLFLGRPALALVAQRGRELQLLGEPLALPFRLRILLVQAGRDAGGATMLREAAHRQLVLERVLADAQPIAHPQLLRPLRARTIHFDLAAVDGCRRDGAGFEETRRPEPGVQTNRRDVGHQTSDIRRQTSDVSFRMKPQRMRFTSTIASSKRPCAGRSK